MANLIGPGESLNKGRIKLNAAIQDAENAKVEAEKASNSAERAFSRAEQVQVDLKNEIFEYSRNIFDGRYYEAVFTWSASPGPEQLFLAPNGFFDHDGRVVVFPLEPNETYTVKIHDAHDSFRLGINDSYPVFPSEGRYYITKKVVDNETLDQYTFTNTASGKYGVLYVSKTGQEPRVQVEKGTVASEYEAPFVRVKDQYTGLEKISEDLSQAKMAIPSKTSTILEDPVTGYPPRPLSVSVVWIGPNEPLQAEPYDEWRQTEGFTYSTDFSEYPVGNPPSDWSDVYSAFKLKRVDTTGLRLDTQSTAGAATGMIWNKVSPELDNEIYLSNQVLNGAFTGQLLSAMHHSTSGASGDGYLFVGVMGANLRVGRKKPSDSSTTELASVPHNIDNSKRYHQVSRVDGNRVRAKIWQDGSPEPKTWTIDVVDPAPMTTSTGVGLYAFLHGRQFQLYTFGVGTGGMRAPHRKVL